MAKLKQSIKNLGLKLNGVTPREVVENGSL